MKAKLVINEQHKLLPNQEQVLKEEGIEYELVKIPSDGLTIDQQFELADELSKEEAVVFVSPVPIVLAHLSYLRGCGVGTKIYVFANDKREKIEQNGKIIYTVAKDGWKLVSIN